MHQPLSVVQIAIIERVGVGGVEEANPLIEREPKEEDGLFLLRAALGREAEQAEAQRLFQRAEHTEGGRCDRGGHGGEQATRAGRAQHATSERPGPGSGSGRWEGQRGSGTAALATEASLPATSVQRCATKPASIAPTKSSGSTWPLTIDATAGPGQ